jgi:hypothetical protein
MTFNEIQKELLVLRNRGFMFQNLKTFCCWMADVATKHKHALWRISLRIPMVDIPQIDPMHSSNNPSDDPA